MDVCFTCVHMFGVVRNILYLYRFTCHPEQTPEQVRRKLLINLQLRHVALLQKQIKDIEHHHETCSEVQVNGSVYGFDETLPS